MKERVIGFLKKYWLPLWCVLSAVLFCGMFGAAEYSLSSSTMKKVVVSASDQGKMFSSNLLVESGDSTYVAKYFSTHIEDQETHTIAPYDVDVYLWNYSLTNLSKWYPSDIDYKIIFTMTDSNGDSSNVTAEDMNGRTVQIIRETKSVNEETGVETINEEILETLNGTTPVLTYTTETQTLINYPSKSAESHYVLRFSGDWDLANDSELCVQALASPYNGGDTAKYRDLSPLGAVIGLRKRTNDDSTGWQAYIAEESEGETVEVCDGYNLVVTGSGKAVITINWDPGKLSCNRYFYNNTVYSFDEDEVEHTDGTATIVISADSGSETNAYRNRYDIQFYKTGSEPSDWSFFKDDGSELSSSVWLSVEIEQ